MCFTTPSCLGFVFSKASAHATLEKTNPKQDGVVKHMPNEIELEFNEPVNMCTFADFVS
jgi:copper transport protein